MTKTSLRVYIRELESLIEGGRVDEVVAHCQHILKTFPMHLETYRLLGKAFLEGRRYADAADIFQRVLASAPDDFVAHVGMSIIRDDEGNLDAALWHMERGFEMQPSNSAIQGELRRLYGRRDGVEPPKVRLTRDALANMYSQGELYSQAIAEIRAVLAEDANRPDLQVMLARAYFRAGQKVEATEMCTALLKKYPYCLDALRILVEILPSTGRAENTQVYRQRLKALDPYSAFASGSVFDTDKVPDTSVTLDKLEFQAEGIKNAAPTWAASLGVKLEDETAKQPSPEWMTTAEKPVEAPVFLEAPQAGEKVPTPQSGKPIPEWLREAGWQESTGAPQAEPAVFTEPEPAALAAAEKANVPDWLKAMAPVGALQPEEPVMPESGKVTFPGDENVPDWLKNLGAQPAVPAETPPPALAEAPLPVPAEALPPAPVEDDTPDFLKEMVQSGPAKAPADIFPGEEIPEFMRGLILGSESVPLQPAETQPARPAAEPAGPPSLEDQEAAMAWLEGLAAKQGAKPEELLTRPEERREAPPEWVQQAVETTPGGTPLPEQPPLPGGEQPPIFEELPQPPAAKPGPAGQPPAQEGDVTIWLRKLEETEGKTGWTESAPISAGMPQEEVPEWLRPLEEKPVAETIPASEPVISDKELPDWLREQPPTAGPEPSIPGWAQEEKAGEIQPPAPTVPEEWVQAGPEAKEISGVQFAVPLAETPVEPEAKPDVIAEPEVKPEVFFEQEAQPVPLSDQPTVIPETPLKPFAAGILAQVPKEKDAEILVAAQAALERSNLDEAMQEYGRLIKKGHLLDEVIHDLREAIYRFPVDIIVWQSLGDAYMRDNRLQDALDAYTKAEELLRR